MRLFSQSDVQGAMRMPDYIKCVEEAHHAHGRGHVIAPDLLHAESEHGEFHVKIGGFTGSRSFFGLKANGGFFDNTERHGLPNILGIIYLCDGDTGMPLAVMDSVAISRNRTGAATAVAARHLARPDSRTLTVCGAGIQARVQIEALQQVLPIQDVFIFGRNSQKVDEFAARCAAELALNVQSISDIAAAVATSDVVVTCTPATSPIIRADWVAAGTFIAAVGADSPGKQELDPRLISQNKVVADILHQVVRVGESQHAIAAGSISSDQIYAELGEIVCGKKPGRENDSEIIVFDSTGTALQDVAAATFLYELSQNENVGSEFNLFD